MKMKIVCYMCIFFHANIKDNASAAWIYNIIILIFSYGSISKVIVSNKSLSLNVSNITILENLLSNFNGVFLIDKVSSSFVLV